MKSYTHEVIRPIAGAPYAAGDLVDASSWKNARALERLRYLRRIKGTPIGSDAAAPPQPETPEGDQLRTDGPTFEEFVEAGYPPENYPPQGYAEKASPGLESFRASHQPTAEGDQAEGELGAGEGVQADGQGLEPALDGSQAPVDVPLEAGDQVAPEGEVLAEADPEELLEALPETPEPEPPPPPAAPAQAKAPAKKKGKKRGR